MYELDEYLNELVSLLDCDPLRRDEIRLEVHSHLRELLEKEKREGRSPTEAAQAAIAQFGTAEEVARRLTAANRGRVPTPARASLAWRALGVVCGLFATVVAVSPAQFYVPKLMAFICEIGKPQDVVWLVPLAYLARFLPWGPVSALVAWAVSRRPWDSLVSCAVLVVVWPFLAGGNHWSWTTWLIGRSNAAAVLVGVIVAAYWLSRRETRAEAQAQLDRTRLE